MKMKKLIVMLGVIVAAHIVTAQDTNESSKNRKEVKIEELKTRLDLTDEQVAQIKELREKYRPEIEAIKNDETKSRSDKMRATADIIDSREADMTQILNEQQMMEMKVVRQEMQTQRKARKERMRDRRRQRGKN